jgi:sugar phosphate isomerase/epimerase
VEKAVVTARLQHAVDVLNQTYAHCRHLGIGLVLENMLPHLFAGRIRDLLWILGALDTFKVGICLDTGHAHLGEDLLSVVHKLSGHLWMIHASDNHRHCDDHLEREQSIGWTALPGAPQGSAFQRYVHPGDRGDG